MLHFPNLPDLPDQRKALEGSNSLADLAARIQAEDEAFRASLRRGLEHALAAGVLLLEAKARLRHGEWLPWLASECPIPERTAQFYMRLARRAPDLESATVADLTVRGASELVKAIARAERSGLPLGVGMHPYEDRGLDVYETPAIAVRALLQVERLSGTIWEPACGPGAIVRVLRDAGHNVIATDIEDYGCPNATAGTDFLVQERAPKGVKTILTNPPFRWANDFVRHALTLAPHVVIFQRLMFLEGVGRSDILEGGGLARVYLFRNRLPMIHRAGWQGPECGSNAFAFCWFVWERDHAGPAELHRIDCARSGNRLMAAKDEETPDNRTEFSEAAE